MEVFLGNQVGLESTWMEVRAGLTETVLSIRLYALIAAVMYPFPQRPAFGRLITELLNVTLPPLK
jgi:hypothetical protein